MLKKILIIQKFISYTGKNDFNYLLKLLYFRIGIRQKRQRRQRYFSLSID